MNANPLGEDARLVVRKLFVTDKDGVEHEIKSKQDLKDIIAQMTPEEFRIWQLRYRFTPVTNRTGNNNYTGTSGDL